MDTVFVTRWVTNLLRDTNSVVRVILITYYVIPVVQDAILVTRNGLNTLSIMPKILERFQESMATVTNTWTDFYRYLCHFVKGGYMYIYVMWKKHAFNKVVL